MSLAKGPWSLWFWMWCSIFDPCADPFLVLNLTFAESPYHLYNCFVLLIWEYLFVFGNNMFCHKYYSYSEFFISQSFSQFVCFQIINNCTIKQTTWNLNNSNKDLRIIFVRFSNCLQWCKYQFYNIHFYQTTKLL